MINAILVDDEKNCCESLELQIKTYCPDVNVKGIYHTGADAIKAVIDKPLDVVFLDIQLTDMSGFDVLRQIENINFHVIFVTAFGDYAIKAIHFNALDYLLKPVDPEELQDAVRRINSIEKKHRQVFVPEMLDYFSEFGRKKEKEMRRIALATSDSFQFVNVADIIYCQSESNYTNFFLKDGTRVMISKTLKSVEDLLDKQIFHRIHQSYLINIDHVRKFVRNESVVVMDNKSILPVAQTRKEEFIKVFSRF
jgi:two-component system LytT family response regulator